jgi:uncharacterized protein (DUF1330 family)
MPVGGGLDLQDRLSAQELKVKARAIIEKFGGKYLARGGQLEVLEDELWRPSRLVVIEFESMERALECLRSAEYLSVRPVRHANARSTVAVVEGL